MKRLLKGIRHEGKGFTLIELLIVVGILAVLAGVVTLGITQFIGRGRLEAANTELHNVQTAVTGLMADAQIAVFPCDPLGTTLDPTLNPGDLILCTGGSPAVQYNIIPYVVTDLRGSYQV